MKMSGTVAHACSLSALEVEMGGSGLASQPESRPNGVPVLKKKSIIPEEWLVSLIPGHYMCM